MYYISLDYMDRVVQLAGILNKPQFWLQGKPGFQESQLSLTTG